ncbi:transcription termination/antitermination factor NusG [candidate division KSB1 bacterium]|nr:MAG: transcription termination/antitermination factor NusG [candidate division KSB1 bacterium]
MEKKWYALHVYSGQESKIKTYLENEIKKEGLESKITDILIPHEDVVEMKNGKKKTKKKMFFPGYMLIEMVLDNKTQDLVQKTPGVINFVGSHNKPQTLHPSEIERIKGRVREKEKDDRTKVPFKVGDSIKVIDGPFNDFTGYVEEVNEEKNKVKVMVSIFGRPTPVELDFLQVQLEKE